MITKKGLLPRDSAGRSIQVGSKTKTGKITLSSTATWTEVDVTDYLEEVYSELFKETPILTAMQSTQGFYFSHTNDDSSQWTVAAGNVFVLHVGRQDSYYIKGTSGQEIELLLSVLGV